MKPSPGHKLLATAIAHASTCGSGAANYQVEAATKAYQEAFDYIVALEKKVAELSPPAVPGVSIKMQAYPGIPNKHRRL